MNVRVMLLLMITALFAAMCWTDGRHTPDAADRLDRQLVRRNAMLEAGDERWAPLWSPRTIASLHPADLRPLASPATNVRLVSDLRAVDNGRDLSHWINLQWEELVREQLVPAANSECLWHRGGCSYQGAAPRPVEAARITRRVQSPRPLVPTPASARPPMLGPCDVSLPAELAAGEYRVTDNFGRVVPMMLTADDLSYYGVRTASVPKYWYLSEHDSRQWFFFRVADAVEEAGARQSQIARRAADRPKDVMLVVDDAPVEAPRPRWQATLAFDVPAFDEPAFDEPCDAGWAGVATSSEPSHLPALPAIIVDAAVEAPQPVVSLTLADLSSNDRWLPAAEDDVDEEDEFERMPISWLVRPHHFLVQSPAPTVDDAAALVLAGLLESPVDAPQPAGDADIALLPDWRAVLLAPVTADWQMACWQCARRSDRLVRRATAWQRQLAANIRRLTEEAATAGRKASWTERLSSEEKSSTPF